MATISTLNVLVKANAGGFKKALKSASLSAAKFGSSMGRIGLQVAKFGAGVGAAAGAGLLLLTKQGYAAIDAMGKLSSNIGIATDKLAGFHLAAELGGVSTELMDKSLKKMQRSVGQAGQGLSTQVRAFAALGLSFEQLSAMSPEQQFAAIAEGMKNLGSASERAAVANDIFGRSGVDLINVLGGGAEALAKAQHEADKLGLSINGIEAKQVEQANDAFLKVKRALTGIGRQIALATAPMVEWLSKKFTEAAEAGGGIREKVGGALNVVTSIIGGVLDGFDLLKISWLAMQKVVMMGLEAISRAVESAVNWSIDQFNRILPDSAKFEKLGVSFADGYAAGIEDINEKIGDILLGPTGKERVSKFFGMVTDESKKAAEAAVEAQSKAFDFDGAAKNEVSKRLNIGFRDEAFAAALRAGGGGGTQKISPTERKLDKQTTILESILAAIRSLNLGLG